MKNDKKTKIQKNRKNWMKKKLLTQPLLYLSLDQICRERMWNVLMLKGRKSLVSFNLCFPQFYFSFPSKTFTISHFSATVSRTI